MTARRHYVELYNAKDGYRWRFVDANGRKLADSGEAYTESRHACEAAAIVCNLDDTARRPNNWIRQGGGKKRWYI